MSEYKDWRGTEIEVGSRILYPSRSGSSVWTNEAIVTALDERQDYRRKIPVLRVQRLGTSGFDRAPFAPSRLEQFRNVTVIGKGEL